MTKIMQVFIYSQDSRSCISQFNELTTKIKGHIQGRSLGLW